MDIHLHFWWAAFDNVVDALFEFCNRYDTIDEKAFGDFNSYFPNR